MVKVKLKKWISAALSAAMLCTMMPVSVFATETSANSEQVSERKVYSGTNIGKQNYLNLQRWSKPMYSYLNECADGTLMRVQYVEESAECVVEYYDFSYKLIRSKVIPQELPIFGGFYATDTNYYLLTGQENLKGAAGVEEFRVTKYDKNWNRLGVAGLTDANTSIPFEAGSARMDSHGKYLAIRTCHKMYNGHQANVTLLVDTDTMEVTDQFTGVWNISTGYVSHSFNQFIKIENGKVVSLDHGDAYPRSVVFCKYGTDVSTGEFLKNEDVTYKEVVEYTKHPSNANITGVTVGGFELSDSSYLVAGNQNTPEATDLDDATRNIYVASVSKDTLDVNMHWLTSYKEGEKSTSTPQMVKVSDNRFVVLWKHDNTVYYRECDGTGKPYGNTYCMEKDAYLSDCAPIVKDNKIIWYVWQNEIVIFYEMDIHNMGKVQTTILSEGNVVETEKFCADGKHTTTYVNKVEPTCTEKGSIASWQCRDCKLRFSDKDGTDKLSDDVVLIPAKGHDFERLKVENNLAYVKCKVCGTEDTKVIATRMYTMFWVDDNYSGSFPSNLKVGDVVNYHVFFDPTGNEDVLEVEVSDPDKVEWTEEKTGGGIHFYGSIKLKKPGKSSVTFRPKWNPDPYRASTYEINIPCDHKWDAGKITKKATCAEAGVKTFTCSVCDTTKTEEIAKLPHKYNTITTKATTAMNGSITSTCSGCGDKKTTTIYYPKTISLSEVSYTYDGENKIPTVVVKDANGKDLKEKIDYTVRYDSDCKNTGRHAVTVDFTGNYSGNKTLYFTIVPQATTTKLSLYGHDDVKVSWNKVTGATGYRVYYRKAGSSNWTTKGDYKETYTALSNLTDGRKYEVMVKPYIEIDSVRYYAPGTISSIYTLKATTLKLTLYGYDDVKVSWSKVSGAAGYKVYYRKAGSSSWKVKGYYTGTYTTLSNLTDGRKYEVMVKPYAKVDSKRYYAPDKTSSIYTLKKILTPSVYKYSSSKVRVKWNNISGESGYQISRSTSKTGTYIVSTYSTTYGNYKTLSTKKSKNYYYKVRAYKTVDGKRIYGPWSNVKSYKLR